MNMTSRSTATVAGSDPPRAALQDDSSPGKVESEVAKLPAGLTRHVTFNTANGPPGACEVATSNKRISGSINDSSTDQIEKDLDQVSGHGVGPSIPCGNENVTSSGLAFEDITVDGFDSAACSSTVVNSNKQTAVADTSTCEPLFEDISMDGEMGQNPTTSRSGQDTDLGLLSSSGGLEADAQREPRALQTCFTGILSREGNCKPSMLQESKTSSQRAIATAVTQEEDPANGEQSISLRSSGNQSRSKPSKRKRRRQAETMEHSGLECAAAKRTKDPPGPASDELVLCLRLQGIDEDSLPHDVAEELVRCLHEPKFHLVRKVVKVLGVKKSLELFHETSQIQEEGGKISVDGGKRRAPGGIFLTLVKTTATPEQTKEIFEQEKKRQREEKLRLKRKREKQLLREKAEWQLQVFRAQLEGGVPNSIVGRRHGEDRNMHKRIFGTVDPDTETDLGSKDGRNISPVVDLRHKIIARKGRALPDSVSQEQRSAAVEEMEVESGNGEAGESRSPVERVLKVQESDAPLFSTEEKLAEEFENMNDFDVGIELDL